MASSDTNSPTWPAGTDWPALLMRLGHARVATRGDSQPGPEQVREILRARAAALAAPAQIACVSGAVVECLAFLLSGESYAIDISYISQTVPLADFTPLFCTPAFVLGITNLRGRIISIVDLRRFFELPEVGLSDLNRVIVVGDGRMEFGILADSIIGTVPVPLDELNPPPDALTGIREEFLVGVSAERLALLDIAKILADRRIVVHEEVG